jgi:predicted RNase H-like HicB family nuclease/DNA-binding XRE family transcriptional regulator
MKYHFKLHKEDKGYWAECCELAGCVSEGDTLEALRAACEEALDVYLYEPDGSDRAAPLPDERLEKTKGLLEIKVAPQKALALLLKNYRLHRKLTQQQAAELLGMKNIYSYQRLEKESNATLTIINRIHKAFPEIKLENLF